MPKKITKKKSSTKKSSPQIPAYNGWDLYRDGITQSLLCKFIIDRHRFWIRTVKGLQQDIGFVHRMEYGSLMHAGFEGFGSAKTQKNFNFDKAVEKGLNGIKHYASRLKKLYPQANVSFWSYVAQGQFKLYCQHYKRRDQKRVYVFYEREFTVPTSLPSGRVIPLRGKYDEGFISEHKKTLGVLQENKVKGDIDEEGIAMSLNLDLQTMLYLHSLDLSKEFSPLAFRECLYNVVLRPGGGKYPIRQKKEETERQFADRMLSLVQENPSKYFHRWNVEVSEKALHKFRQCVLYPLLEQLADWWDSIKNNPLDPFRTYSCPPNGDPVTFHNGQHFIRPFGVYDTLALGNRGDYFDYIISGGTNLVGLQKKELFSELTAPSLATEN